MAYTLDELANDCRQALQSDSGPGGREKIRECLQRALRDEGFLAACLGPEATKERDVIYEDPQLGFCICAHVYTGPRDGTPHDHGSTWAIYGQAEGETEMSDWQIVEAPVGDRPGKVERIKSYRLRPGEAHIYEVGDVHAPMRSGPTKLIRIEGRNTDSIERTPLEPVS